MTRGRTRIDALFGCDDLLRGDNAARHDAPSQKSAGAARQINESANVLLSENAPAQQGGWKHEGRDGAPAIGRGGGKVHASDVGRRAASQRDSVAGRRGKQWISRRILYAGGATLDEIITKTGWQRQALRGFISKLASRHSYNIESACREENKAQVSAIAQ